MKNRPMQGIKVLEIANWVAAPSCAMMLSDMGAEVFKIEPPEGDALRGILESPPIPGAPGNLTFYLDNRGKKSIIIDFTNVLYLKFCDKIRAIIKPNNIVIIVDSTVNLIETKVASQNFSLKKTFV